MKNIILGLTFLLVAPASVFAQAHGVGRQAENVVYVEQVEEAAARSAAKAVYTCEKGPMELDTGRGPRKTIMVYKLFKNKEPVKYVDGVQENFDNVDECQARIVELKAGK